MLEIVWLLLSFKSAISLLASFLNFSWMPLTRSTILDSWLIAYWLASYSSILYSITLVLNLNFSILCASLVSAANSSDVVSLVRSPKFYISPETESIDVFIVPLLSLRNSLSEVYFFLNSLSSSNFITSWWSSCIIFKFSISSEHPKKSLSSFKVVAFWLI